MLNHLNITESLRHCIYENVTESYVILWKLFFPWKKDVNVFFLLHSLTQGVVPPVFRVSYWLIYDHLPEVILSHNGNVSVFSALFVWRRKQCSLIKLLFIPA